MEVNELKTTRKQDSWDVVATWLRERGWNVLARPKLTANGPDLTACNDERCVRVEIKTARKLRNGTYQTSPIDDVRRFDDLVAVVLDGQILFSSMVEHLQLCSEKGYRNVTWFGHLLP